MVDVDLVDMDDGSGFKEPAANRRSLVDERRMLFEKIVTSESQPQQPPVNRATVASKNSLGGVVRRSNYFENDEKRSDDGDSSPEPINKSDSDASSESQQQEPPVNRATVARKNSFGDTVRRPNCVENDDKRSHDGDSSPEPITKSDSDVSRDQNAVPSAELSPNRVPPPSPPLTKLAPSPIESDLAAIDCDQNVSPKRISYYRAVSDRGADKPTPSSRSSVTTCFVANDRIDEDRGNDCGNIVAAAQSSRAFADEPNEPEVSKRVSYHRAVFESGGTTRARPKSSPIVENTDSVASVTVLQRRRSHEDLIQCKSEQSSNFSSRTTCSDNHVQGGAVSSSPPKPPPSSSSSAHYPEELNPFSDDDETEDDHCGRPSTEGTSAKPTNSANSTNPFGSDSDDEDEDKADSSSKNPFGSDDEEEPSETPAKSNSSAVVSPKVPVPLPRTVEKLTINASPRPNPRPRNKHNDSSNDVSPTASCRSMPSSTVRRISGDSLELSLKKSPSSVNSTMRKKKPAPPPPPLAQNISKETNSTCDEQKGDSSTKYTSNATSIENQKTMTALRKTKKGPAPARPIPIRRPVKEMPIEDIKTELSDIEIKQQELERQGLQLEESIREKTESESAESAIVEEMVLQLFELVNEKNELFRRKSELTNMRKMHQLEEEHAETEYQIRCLMLRPESNKTDSDKTKEEELIKRLLEIVEKRNEIIETMENDRLRRTAEDLSVTTQLADDEIKPVKKNKKKSKKDKQHKESGCGGGDSDSVKSPRYGGVQMPSTPPPPTQSVKPRGAFLRRKVAELVNGGQSKKTNPGNLHIFGKSGSGDIENSESGTKESSGEEASGCGNSNNSNPKTPLPWQTNAVGNRNIEIRRDPMSYSKTSSSDNNDTDDDTNDEGKLASNETRMNFAADQNTRMMASSGLAAAATEATSFSASSSSSTSSHRQRFERQITRTSETKTCIKSDKAELSRLSEIQNLHLGHTKLRKASIESILDSKETTAIDGEPLITYPESPTPSSSCSNITVFPSSTVASDLTSSSRKNSNASIIDDLHSGAFERRLSSAAKAKIITEQFIGGEKSMANEFYRTLSSSMQTNDALSDTRHEQRTLTSDDLTHHQSQNVSSSTVKRQADSYLAAEKIQKALAAQQQTQTITSTGVINFSSAKGFSSSSSQKKQFNNSSSSNNFIKNEMADMLTLKWQTRLSDYLKESFDDLAQLQHNLIAENVDNAIRKYSNSIKEVVEALKDGGKKSKTHAPAVLDKMREMMTKAWLVPTHGHQLGNSLCDALRECDGIKMLISNCDSNDSDVKFSSIRLLEQCLTTDNRAYVVNNGLDKVVCVACKYSKESISVEHSRISTGILENMFKHSEGTCEQVVRLGGLDAIILECRKNDLETLRHCASALANLSLYGGAENQVAMIKRKVPMWLFPLAFQDDDNIKYYACLAIAVLVANKEIEAEVLRSGTLNLVEPFVTSHNPSDFAKSNLSHAHGQSQMWLQRFVPVLSSKREEACNLAAFHFCMEAGIKRSQGNAKMFAEIGAIECLKEVASCPNAIASKFAAQALRLIGETVPHKLIQQVPLWSVEDVKEWVKQIGFSEYCDNFEESRVDGDLLLQLTEDNLKDDIGMKNGIRRTRFARELQRLKRMADYSSRDVDNLNGFLQSIGPEFRAYTYSMLNAGVDKDYLKSLSEGQLLKECGIVNSIHRLRILEAIKCENTFANTFQEDLEKPLDVFISYRRSNGSQLASLLKVHLQVRNFSVFIDVEKLEAGKFDNNLLQSIKQASNFLLVLTPNALNRCFGDVDCKDWVHREIVAALQSNCNIIPITDNFDWPPPEQLPEDMRAICHFNGIKWIHDYQDACVEKLERFIRGEVNSKIIGQDLPTTVPHGSRHVKSDISRSPIAYHRALSSESTRESDSSGSKE